MHKAAIHNFKHLLVNAGKFDQILCHLQSSTAKPAIANVFRGERKQETESRGEVEAGQKGEEVSHFPSCEAVWEWGPMRVCRVAATFWAERQVRAGGGATRRLTCMLLEEEKERQAELITLFLRLPDLSAKIICFFKPAWWYCSPLTREFLNKKHHHEHCGDHLRQKELPAGIIACVVQMIK